MFDKVRELYADDKRMLINGQLLWLWRRENDIWNHPGLTSVSQSQQEVETEQKSTKPKTDSSTEPMTPETLVGLPVDGE
jgi:hypothetical protein